MSLFKRNSSIKAVIEAKIDFRDEKEYGRLEKGKAYYLPRNIKQEKPTGYDEIKSYVTDLIEEDLKKHLAKTIGLQIKEIRVTADYEGSIELVFIVLFNAFQFVAGMKDFYDNVRLVRNYSEKYINKKLEEKYGSVFKVDTDVEYPTIDRYDEMFWMHRKSGIRFPFASTDSYSKRDGLFYYLLFSNLILLTIIGWLIFKAVKSFYGF